MPNFVRHSGYFGHHSPTIGALGVAASGRNGDMTSTAKAGNRAQGAQEFVPRDADLDRLRAAAAKCQGKGAAFGRLSEGGLP